MCGIFGIVLKKNSEIGSEKLLRSLFIASESRGKEASGIFIERDETVDIFKSADKATKFVEDKMYQKLVGTSWCLAVGHSRLATNGSIGDNRNNQPVLRGDWFGVHNGIITNEDDLWKMIGEKPELTLDTEVLMALLQSLMKKYGLVKSIRKAFSLLEGEATVALRNSSNRVLILATNTGSLYFSWLNDGSLIFASERYILGKVLSAHGMAGEILQLPAGRGLCIDGQSWKSEVFELKRGSIVDDFGKARKLQIIDNSSYRKIGMVGINNKFDALRKHDFDYERIYALKRCRRCILPITTPFISFDENGVCSYCSNHQKITYRGIKALLEIIDPYRSKNGEPDCIVGFSGGRDSSYGLHILKRELRLNPIAYTFDWGMLSDMGRQNAARVVGKLGVEHIVVSADIAKKRENVRKNILAWMKKPELGMVPLFMAGDKESEYHMNELVKKTGIKLVIYFRGNSFERDEFKTGHAGVSNADPGGVIHNLAITGKIKLALYYGGQFLSNPAYLNPSIWDTAKAYTATYLIPHDYLYLWHYLSWEEKKVISTLRKEYNWQSPDDNPATWRIDDASPAFYNYIYYQIQGFTEHDSLRSHQIREGELSRNEAWEIVCEENRPRYKALQWYFDVLKLNGDEVLSVVDGMKRLY